MDPVDDQRIAQTRHLDLTPADAGARAGAGTPAAASPASPSAPTAAVPAAASGDDAGTEASSSGLITTDSTTDDDGGCGDGGGVRRARGGSGSSTAVAGVAAGARPMMDDGNGSEGRSEYGDDGRDGSEAGEGALIIRSSHCSSPLEGLPVEVLFHIMDFLDVNDLLSASRTSHQLRSVSLTPLLHVYRLRRARDILPPLLASPTRPSLADLISRSIFLTNTTVVSRRLARSLVSIRLSRRLAARPSPETLAERAVLPKECVPGSSSSPSASVTSSTGRRKDGGATVVMQVSPVLVQQRKAVERERIKDGLRRWVEGKWSGEVKAREERVRRWHESRGVGRVWRLRRFWERVGRGEELPVS